MNLVSIITAVDGDLDGLTRLTRSLIAQSYPYWEMVLVSDDLRCYRSLLEQRGIRDPRLRFLSTACPGSGLEAARNTGVFFARGNVIAPLDTSSVCHPERLDRLLPMALEHGICGNNQSQTGRSGYADSRSMFPPGDGVRWLPLNDKRLPMDMLFRRDLIRCRPRAQARLGQSADFDTELLINARPVPLMETVLQQRHACSAPDWRALPQQPPPSQQRYRHRPAEAAQRLSLG